MEFKNKCPHCGKSELYWSIFYAGNETGDWGTFPATGRKERGSAEGHIFCKNCDADYSCQGHEHISGGKSLTVTKKRFKSSKADAYKLKKGKYVYNKATSTTSSKNNSSTKTRKIIGSPSRKVKQLALKIVGDKTGYKAMRAICDWMDKNIWYSGYGNFCRSPNTVLNTKHGNCCDQTRLILQLFDSAGLSEYYDMYYVHVHEQQGHVYAQLKSKKTGKRVYVDPASDVRGCYGYVCQGYSHGNPKSKYPNMPF
jgi:transglutaminase-like putative cysteine protease